MKAEWEYLQSEHCIHSFMANAAANFFPRKCYDKQKKNMTGESLDSLKKNSGAQRCCLCGKTYCCCDVTTIKNIFRCKTLNKRVLEQKGGGPLEKNRRVLHGKKVLRQQTEVSKRTVTLLQHTNNLSKDSVTFTQQKL